MFIWPTDAILCCRYQSSVICTRQAKAVSLPVFWLFSNNRISTKSGNPVLCPTVADALVSWIGSNLWNLSWYFLVHFILLGPFNIPLIVLLCFNIPFDLGNSCGTFISPGMFSVLWAWNNPNLVRKCYFWCYEKCYYVCRFHRKQVGVYIIYILIVFLVIIVFLLLVIGGWARTETLVVCFWDRAYSYPRLEHSGAISAHSKTLPASSNFCAWPLSS